ncbi:hypothetical protein BHE74_00040501 [Ensete ventricosum]|nr:hypothetical protein BHE74_00040501 [Ensete ventricosum]
MWPSPLRASATFACRRLLPLRPPSIVSSPVRPSSVGGRMATANVQLLRVCGRRFVAVLPQPASYSRIAIVRIYYLCVVVAMQ